MRPTIGCTCTPRILRDGRLHPSTAEERANHPESLLCEPECRGTEAPPLPIFCVDRPGVRCKDAIGACTAAGYECMDDAKHSPACR